MTFFDPRTADEAAAFEIASKRGFEHWNTGGNCRALAREICGHIQMITYGNEPTYDGPLASDEFVLAQSHADHFHCGELTFEAFGNVPHLLNVADAHMAAICIGALARRLESYTSLTKEYDLFLVARGLPSMCGLELLWEFGDDEFFRDLPNRAQAIEWLVDFNDRWDVAVQR